jgi:hypothetical protein
MKTGHEYIGGLWKASYELRTHCYDLADLRPHREVFVALALDCAGITADALLGVLKKIVITH